MSDYPHWPTVKAALKAWVSHRTGIDPASIHWRAQPSGFEPGVYAILDLVGYVPAGTDEIRYAHDATKPAGKDMIQTVTGQRTFSLSTRVYCRTNEDDRDAWAYVTQLVDRMREQDSLDEVLAAELGLRDAEAPLDLTRIEGNRERTAAQVDVGFNVVMRRRSTPRSYIDKATVEISLTDPTGATVYQDTTIHQV